MKWSRTIDPVQFLNEGEAQRKAEAVYKVAIPSNPLLPGQRTKKLLPLATLELPTANRSPPLDSPTGVPATLKSVVERVEPASLNCFVERFQKPQPIASSV